METSSVHLSSIGPSYQSSCLNERRRRRRRSPPSASLPALENRHNFNFTSYGTQANRWYTGTGHSLIIFVLLHLIHATNYNEPVAGAYSQRLTLVDKMDQSRDIMHAASTSKIILDNNSLMQNARIPVHVNKLNNCRDTWLNEP